MNVLDENIAAPETEKLRHWKIPFRRVGIDFGAFGLLDENVIPLLQHLPRPTFFTHDVDYLRKSLCHDAYALAYLDLPDNQAAEFIRKFLRHPAFNSHAKRQGIVGRIHAGGVQFWRKNSNAKQAIEW